MSDSKKFDLVADVGATNARFRLAQAGAFCRGPAILPTEDFSDASALLRAATEQLGSPNLGRALLAIAGPRIDEQSIRLTNVGTQFHVQGCSDELAAPCRLVNDFFALAHGVPHFESLLHLQGARGATGNKAVLGPGSGLGMAMLAQVPGSSAWWVMASEGGNADLAIGSHLEVELWGVLTAAHGHVSWETVLSGPGLVNLYRAMCTVWGASAEEYDPEQISSLGSAMSDPICHQSLETFCGFLGAAAGNLALTAGAFGGVYIAGGIVPQMVDFIASSPLRRRFDERGRMSETVADIPLYVVTEDHAGLFGALHCLDSPVF